MTPSSGSLENTFKDEAFGLTPAILQRLTTDAMASDESFRGFQESTFPIHDRIMGVQSSVLTMLMNPTRLRRIYDNEVAGRGRQGRPDLARADGQRDGSAIFTELDKAARMASTRPRKPMISSLRRNLQRRLVDRLIDLAQPDDTATAAAKPISNLALTHLRQLKAKIEKALQAEKGTLDAYSKSHLEDAQIRIVRALERGTFSTRRDLRGPSTGFFHAPQGMECNRFGCSCRNGGWDTRTTSE